VFGEKQAGLVRDREINRVNEPPEEEGEGVEGDIVTNLSRLPGSVSASFSTTYDRYCQIITLFTLLPTV
jgi:hypothetical protein